MKLSIYRTTEPGNDLHRIRKSPAFTMRDPGTGGAGYSFIDINASEEERNSVDIRRTLNCPGLFGSSISNPPASSCNRSVMLPKSEWAPIRTTESFSRASTDTLIALFDIHER